MAPRAEEFEGKDEEKEMIIKEKRLHEMGKAFIYDLNLEDDWKKDLARVTKAKILKMPQILKSIMYLLCFTREQICTPNTQNFCWKIAKKFICESMPECMSRYQVLG